MRLHYDLTFQKVMDFGCDWWRSYGIRMPFVAAKRFAVYAWYLIFRSGKTFSLDDRQFEYAIHLLNATFLNERAVEIPIALDMFPLKGDILEVGNVLSQYIRFPHDVVDKYEKAEGVQNVDIADYHPNKLYDLIISISTLEHVGWDEVPKEPEKIIRAMHNLKALLKPGGRLLVTMPLGYNDCLDTCLQDGSLGFSRLLFMKRISRMNGWKETIAEDALRRKYGTVYPFGNAIAIGVFEKPSQNQAQRD